MSAPASSDPQRLPRRGLLPTIALTRYSYGVNRAATVATLGSAVLIAVLSVAMTVLVGRVVGAVPDVIGDRPGAMSTTAFGLVLAALLVVLVVAGLLPALQQLALEVMVNDARRDITRAVTEPLLQPIGVAHLEDPAIQDQANRARGLTWAGFQVRVGLEALPELLRGRLTLLGATAVVGQLFAWWVAVALAAATLGMEWHRGRVLASELDSYFGNTESARKAAYVYELGMREAPKEVRVFGLGPWLVGRHRTHSRETWEPIWRARRRGLVAAIPMTALHLGLHGFAIVLVGRAALAGDLSLTAVATVVPAILAVGMSYSGTPAVHARRAAAAHAAMHDLPAAIAHRHPERSVTAVHPVERMPTERIRFEKVTFRYPGSGVEVLRDLSLELRTREALALVGVNGAGKSTLVKLLAGAYEPTSGRITVDGVDLRDLDRRAWQRRVAAISQDFVRFPLSATENVVLGAIEHAQDERTFRRVVARSGAAGPIGGLPGGWDTVLDKTFEGGVDLSGGEWQRIALARALFAVDAGASVLVLDEPAAALDVRAEAELVERYLDLTSGLTSLIISHRFSVVRDAHRICVLDGGRITESGTHAELVAAGRRYAQLFRLQAQRYAAGEDDV